MGISVNSRTQEWACRVRDTWCWLAVMAVIEWKRSPYVTYWGSTKKLPGKKRSLKLAKNKIVKHAKCYISLESSGPQDSESKRFFGKESTVQKLSLKAWLSRFFPVMHRDFLCLAHTRTFPLEVTHVPLDLRESPRVQPEVQTATDNCVTGCNGMLYESSSMIARLADACFLICENQIRTSGGTYMNYVCTFVWLTTTWLPNFASQ